MPPSCPSTRSSISRRSFGKAQALRVGDDLSQRQHRAQEKILDGTFASPHGLRNLAHATSFEPSEAEDVAELGPQPVDRILQALETLRASRPATRRELCRDGPVQLEELGPALLAPAQVEHAMTGDPFEPAPKRASALPVKVTELTPRRRQDVLEHVLGVDPCAETLNRRRLPGDGDIDLPELIRTLREGGSPAPLGVEIFATDLSALPPKEVARRCANATRTVIEQSLHD